MSAVCTCRHFAMATIRVHPAILSVEAHVALRSMRLLGIPDDATRQIAREIVSVRCPVHPRVFYRASLDLFWEQSGGTLRDLQAFYWLVISIRPIETMTMDQLYDAIEHAARTGFGGIPGQLDIMTQIRHHPEVQIDGIGYMELGLDPWRVARFLVENVY